MGLLRNGHFGPSPRQKVRTMIRAVTGHSYRKATSGSTLVDGATGTDLAGGTGVALVEIAAAAGVDLDF